MTRLRALFRFAGRWLGPALILLAALLFFFPPMPFADASRSPALAGAIVSAIAWFFARPPNQQRNRRLLATCALTAFAFYGWRLVEERRGYHEEIVSFDNRGAQLVGTLYLPDRPGKVPGMVWLPGSGATPRSFYRGYAAHFAQAGYAVLVYDLRGVGDSSGLREAKSFLDADKNLELSASDASKALSVLAARPEVRAEAAGFTGLSIGGFIAPRAAEINGNAAFLLVITSPATTLFQLMHFQNCTLRVNPCTSPEQVTAEANRARIPDFDPMPSLRALNIPGLWVMGDQDSRVPNTATARNLDELRKVGKPYQYHLIPGAWHGMVVGPKTLVLDTMDTWLAQVTAQKP